MHYCVTGANGFIGRRLVDALLRKNYSIKVLTRRHDYVFPAGIQVVIGDLTSSDCQFDNFLLGCDVLFHCAGETRDEAVMRILHVDGTQRLIQAVLKSSKQKKQKVHWVQLSSVGVYGPPSITEKSGRIVTEEAPIDPDGVYELTKARADQLIIEASAGGKMTYSIVRPSNVIGTGMTNQSLNGLIQAVKKGLFFYIGKPEAVATYIHVDDVVSALIKCAIKPYAKGQIYNISNDCLFEDMIKFIALSLGVKVPWVSLPEFFVRHIIRLFEGHLQLPLTQSRIDALVNRTRYPADKIASELGFKFSNTMPSAIKELVKDFCR